MAEPRDDAPPTARRFFLETTPEEGRPELAAGELDHALRVLRLAAGDSVLGLDGRGGAWPLRVSARTKRGLELEPAGEARREPAAGEPGAPLPWIELALSPPRGERAEELVDRATQLGVSAVRWLAAERTPPRARELSAHRAERLDRIAREATKQCRRLWVPELEGPLGLAELAARARGSSLVLLDPSPEVPLLARVLDELAAAGPWRRDRPLVLCAGPEGGFAPDELALLDAAGARRARLGPLVLRIETAAEAALAVAVHAALDARLSTG